MKKILIVLSLIFFAYFFPLSANARNGASSNVSATGGTAEIEFDYSKYLTPAAYEAIKASQGMLFVATPLYDEVRPEIKMGQALVINPEKGLILSVKHIFSKYIATVWSEMTIYNFILGEFVFPVRPKYASSEFDLVIFELANKNQANDFAQLKPVIFSKVFEPFETYYSLERSYDFVPGRGYSPDMNLPFKGQLVAQKKEIAHRQAGPRLFIPIIGRYLWIDRTLKQGFSGAGLLSANGDAVGIVIALYDGYSIAIASETILNFIEEYKGWEKAKENQVQKNSGQEPKGDIPSQPQPDSFDPFSNPYQGKP